MKKLSVALFCLSFLLFCTVIGFCLSVLLFPFGLFHPVIACDTEVLKLGTVGSDTDVDCRFEIRNDGNRELKFLEVVPACGSGNEIHIVDFPLEPLPPGEKRELALRFHPYACRGNVTKKLVISSDDPRSPRYSLSVSATVEHVPPAQSPPPTLAPALSFTQ